MQRVAFGAVLAVSLVLAGCTARGLDSLPAPIQGTVRVDGGTLVSVKHPVPNTTVPVHAGLAPEANRPGVAFRVLPHHPGDRHIVVAWVDSGSGTCGAVSEIWAHETTMQIVVTLYQPPTLSARHGRDCTAQGVIHIQALSLEQPIADRTTNAFNGIAAFGAF